MKPILLFISLLVSGVSFAQNDTQTVSDANDVNHIVEKMPVYPGGIEAMYTFLGENLKYPKSEAKAKISGICYVSFIVDKDGSITEARVMRGVPNGPLCDQEALRVVNMMPKWEPGMQSGKFVRVQFSLPVKFTLPRKKE